MKSPESYQNNYQANDLKVNTTNFAPTYTPSLPSAYAGANYITANYASPSYTSNYMTKNTYSTYTTSNNLTSQTSPKTYTSESQNNTFVSNISSPSTYINPTTHTSPSTNFEIKPYSNAEVSAPSNYTTYNYPAAKI